MKINSNERKFKISEQIKPLFIDIEKVRLRQLRKSIVSFIIILFSIGVTFISSSEIISDPNLKLITAYLGIAIFVVSLYIIRQPIKIYQNYYKDNIVPSLLKSFGNFEYSESDKSIDLDILTKYKIVPNFGILYSEDYFKGMIDDVTFEFCELALKEPSGNSYNPKTIFKGGAILLTMPFDFTSHVIVKKEEGVTLNLETEKITGKKTVSFKDKVFEDCFEVYSDNDEEARHLLSPEMMEQLIKFKTLFKDKAEGKSLGCEFKENKILFLMEYKKDLLEPSNLFVPSYKVNSLHIIRDELKSITNIINQLKLDNEKKLSKASEKITVSE